MFLKLLALAGIPKNAGIINAIRKIRVFKEKQFI
jgi:hypothetical protein